MLVAVCSLKGSPGVTTLATALAARWPAQENTILVEADPAGGDIMARFRLPESPGLVSLAAAARGRAGNDPLLLARNAQTLPPGLRVVLGPVGAEQARAALSVLASGAASPLRSAANQPGTTVIVDCGRVDPDSPAFPIIREADAMLLLSRPRDDELAHLAFKLDAAQRWSRLPCLVLVGDGYPTPEVSGVLRIPVMGRVPRDDKGAAVLRGQGYGWRRHSPARSRLGRAAARIAVNAFAHWYSANNTAVSSPHLRLAVPAGPGAGTALQPIGIQAGNGVRR
jgi:Mrp family chromosome partitioning ATPase